MKAILSTRFAGVMATVLAVTLAQALRRLAGREREIQRILTAERALRDLVTVFDHTTDYVVQTDEQGRIRYMNPALREAEGIGAHDPVDGLDVTRFNPPETNRLFADTILPAVQAHGVWVGETKVFVAERRLVPVSQMVIAHRRPDGHIHLYSSIMRDITEQMVVRLRQQVRETMRQEALRFSISLHEQENARLLQLTRHDALTGVLNRAGFNVFLERHGETWTLALLYIDLDGFKAINDTHGHAVGDELLQEFAHRLQGLASATDAVARLGGDEFVIALTDVYEDSHPVVVAEAVLAASRTRFEVAGQVLEMSASVGVALGSKVSGGWRELLANADRLLYQAKAAGRDRYVISPPA